MSSDDIVVEARGLSKCYHIYDQPAHRLKQALYPRLQRRLGLPVKAYYREFWALHDVSFTIRRGETFGIVGRNGAGKSTLLQLVAGTLAPTQGELRVHGRVAALLELGSGFNPEFTGRENVFLNAALLGLGREETESRYDEILAFAGIGDFIDQPVKTYSSGMVVRLAFAVSVCVEPDILIVDEALAVGDAAFQYKCLARLEKMQRQGTTLLFVSHDMGMVQNFCRQALYLDGGRVKNIGTPEAIAAHYFFDTREMQRQALGRTEPFQQQAPLGSFPQSAAFGDGLGAITRAVFARSQTSQEHLDFGQAIEIDVSIDLPANSADHFLAVVVQNVRLMELAGQRFPLPDLPQGGRLHHRISLGNPYANGDYFVTLRLMHKGEGNQTLPRQSQIAALHFQTSLPGGGFPFIGLVDIPASVGPIPDRPFRVVALMTVRNEARYLDRCLRHLSGQGVEVCLIDNGSTDDTVAIAQRWLGKGVVAIEHLPYAGHFDLAGILRNEEELALKIDADWFIHHDADEIRQSRIPGETLKDAIRRLDAEGYNAINFDEFVFPPAADAEVPADGDYVTALRLAYHFAPSPRHRVNAWKKTACRPDLVTRAGHQVLFPGQNLAPENFVLRHYPFLSAAHLVEKYTKERTYSEHEVKALGWHGKRAAFKAEDIVWPDPGLLVDPEREGWGAALPWKEHPFLGGQPGRSGTDDDGPPPAPFVVGVSRSGTTLLRLMLDAHPDLAIPAETHFLQRLDPAVQRDTEAFLEVLRTAHTWGDFHADEEELRREIDALQPFDVAAAVRVFFRQYAQRQGKARWGDKTPYNAECLEHIHKLLPEARFIHIIRDGRDVALSLRDKWWGPGKDLREAARHWRARIENARRQAARLPAGCYIEIRYEDLIRSPETVLRRLCGFLELPFAGQMLDYHLTAARRLDEIQDHKDLAGQVTVPRDQHLSIHHNTHRPPDPAQSGKWQQQFSAAEKSLFADEAGELLASLGYEV